MDRVWWTVLCISKMIHSTIRSFTDIPDY